MSLEDILGKINPNRADSDLEVIKKAYAFAKEAHQDQLRESGEPYIKHPDAVANILAEMQLDQATIAAALLHDVVEDTKITLDDIKREFGEEIALLVDGVTKLSKFDFQTKEEQQAESFRKMFVAMAKDIRVILIKLADRLHNMRTLKYLPDYKQKRVAMETLEIYAPLAHRLGMSMMKWEFEDLALRYMDPEAYYELVEKVVMKRTEREEYIEEARKILTEALTEIGIFAEIQGRPKHFYSIFKKMENQEKDFSEIWDLLGMRAVVDTERECYAVLGCVHSLWKPIPGKFKDYIAMPKSNMYQSLHTTVIGPKGEPLEVQIRTWEMHRTAEYGIAAHWRYKESRSGNEEFEDKIAWLRQTLEWQQETRDVQEFMETLKIDLFSDEVYVFTPKGDVKTLPKDSTPVDFAYSVHSSVGHKCVGARVNGRMVSLEYKLKTGDIVEIVTKNNTSPSADWLNFLKTSKARSKVRQWIKEQRREESVAKGRELIEKELRRLSEEVHSNLKDDKLVAVAKKFGFLTIDDLLESVGYGKIRALQVVGKLLPGKVEEELEEPKVPQPRRRSGVSQGVRVKGVENVLVKFARCCSPVPGDDIVGYVTKSRGVSIHRADCPNLKSIIVTLGERKIEVEWEEGKISATHYPVELEVLAQDSVGLLSSLMGLLNDLHTRVDSLNARINKNHMAIINLTIETTDLDQMNNIIKKLRRLEGILEVKRVKQL